MSALELVYDYFEDHVRAAAVISERQPLALGLTGFLVGGLSLFVAQALAGSLVLFSFSPVSLALALLWKLVTAFFLTAALHLILEMEGVQGSAGGLFVQLGLSDLVWAASVPLILLGKVLFPSAPWVLTVLLTGVGLASLGLKARGLQDNYHIPPGRAWITLGLPYMGLALAAVLAFALGMMLMMLELLRMFH